MREKCVWLRKGRWGKNGKAKIFSPSPPFGGGIPCVWHMYPPSHMEVDSIREKRAWLRKGRWSENGEA